MSLTESSLCNNSSLVKQLLLLLLPNCQNIPVENLPLLLLQIFFPLPGLRVLYDSCWAVWVPLEVTYLYPLTLDPADLQAGREKGLGRRPGPISSKEQQLPSPPVYSAS